MIIVFLSLSLLDWFCCQKNFEQLSPWLIKEVLDMMEDHNIYLCFGFHCPKKKCLNAQLNPWLILRLVTNSLFTGLKLFLPYLQVLLWRCLEWMWQQYLSWTGCATNNAQQVLKVVLRLHRMSDTSSVTNAFFDVLINTVTNLQVNKSFFHITPGVHLSALCVHHEFEKQRWYIFFWSNS